MRQLRRRAAEHSIDPARVIFAPRMPLDVHLARMGRANLFLDTSPSNAHTTASDALWAGLPVLTCQGESFSSRVAASLLHAVHMPELVTESLSEYQQRAVSLAMDKPNLAALRGRLHSERMSAPLFDSHRFCRHLESAYTTMAHRAMMELPPEPFSVEAEYMSKETL